MLIQDLHLYVLCTYQLHLFSVTATATYSNNNCDYCRTGMFVLFNILFVVFFCEGGDDCTCALMFPTDCPMQLKHPPGLLSFSFLSVCTALSPDWTTVIYHLVNCVHYDWGLNCCIDNLNFVQYMYSSLQCCSYKSRCHTTPCTISDTVSTIFLRYARLFPYQSQLWLRQVL